MIGLIAKALSEFDEAGVAVITSDEQNGWYAQEIAEYVLQTLNGLKCSIEHRYNRLEDTYFIESVM